MLRLNVRKPQTQGACKVQQFPQWRFDHEADQQPVHRCTFPHLPGHGPHGLRRRRWRGDARRDPGRTGDGPGLRQPLRVREPSRCQRGHHQQRRLRHGGGADRTHAREVPVVGCELEVRVHRDLRHPGRVQHPHPGSGPLGQQEPRGAFLRPCSLRQLGDHSRWHSLHHDRLHPGRGHDLPAQGSQWEHRQVQLDRERRAPHLPLELGTPVNETGREQHCSRPDFLFLRY